MAKWTTQKPVSFWDRHFSDANERIVPTRKGTPLGVAPKGMFTPGIFRDYDEITVVDLRPKHLSITLNESDRLATKDGVKIGGIIEITARIKEENNLLVRLVSNEEEEDRTLYSHIKKSVRIIISTKDWTDLVIFTNNEHASFKSQILDYVSETNICFMVLEVIDINFSPIDKDFADLIEKRRKEKEQEKQQIEKIIAAQERIKLEYEREQIRLAEERKKEKELQEHQLKLDKDRHDADLKKKEDEHKAELKRKKEEKDLENNIFAERVKLIKENPTALAIIDPATYKEIELAKLKLQLEAESSKNKLLEQLALKGLDNKLAKTQGQIEDMSAMASERLGIDGKLFLTDQTTEDENKNLKEEIKKLKKQGSSTKTEKSNSEPESDDSKNKSQPETINESKVEDESKTAQ
jgi:hypothetical protein